MQLLFFLFPFQFGRRVFTVIHLSHVHECNTLQSTIVYTLCLLKLCFLELKRIKQTIMFTVNSVALSLIVSV